MRSLNTLLPNNLRESYQDFYETYEIEITSNPETSQQSGYHPNHLPSGFVQLINTISSLFTRTIHFFSWEENYVDTPKVKFNNIYSVYKNKIEELFPGTILPHLTSEGLPKILTENDKELLGNFLYKLSSIEDFKYKNPQKRLLCELNEILETAFTDPTFKEEILIPLCFEADSSCEDRTSLIFHRIFLETALKKIKTQNCPKKLLKYLLGYSRLQILSEKAELYAKRKRLNDFVEILLYLQTNTQSKLNLPFTIETMTYPDSAPITNDELRDIEQQVLSEDIPKIDLLTEPLVPTYDERGKIIKIGHLSPTNPYQTPISEIWTHFLQQTFPDSYQQDPSSEERLLDPKWLQEEKNRQKNISKELTLKFLAECT